MEAFKFNTTVLENGIIQIPEISQFAHRPVEIFILEKWTGFMKGSNPDSNKFKYLQEKYL